MTDNDYYGKLGQRVDCVSRVFWKSYAGILLRHGIHWHDVRQQAWVELLILNNLWPTNPTKYLHGRLIDWMRHATRWTKSTRTPSPIMESFECYDGRKSLELGRHTKSMGPSSPPPNYEQHDIFRRLYQAAKADGSRSKAILGAYIDGESMRHIGEDYMISESRVSQIIKGVICRFRQAVGVMGMVALLGAVSVPSVWALDWVLAVEADEPTLTENGTPLDDLAIIRFYLKGADGENWIAPVDVPATSAAGGGHVQAVLSGETVDGGKEVGSIQSTAVDTAGNESVAISHPVLIDAERPAAPLNMTVTTTIGQGL